MADQSQTNIVYSPGPKMPYNPNMQAMQVLQTMPPPVLGYAGGNPCRYCGFKGQNHVRYIVGRIAKIWSFTLSMIGCCQMTACCPRIYDNLIICGNCGAELNRVEPISCCDVCWRNSLSYRRLIIMEWILLHWILPNLEERNNPTIVSAEETGIWYGEHRHFMAAEMGKYHLMIALLNRSFRAALNNI